jgi:hypothetical protein
VPVKAQCACMLIFYIKLGGRPLQLEQLTDGISADIDNLFARLADIDQRLRIKLTKEIGDQFAQHQSFKNLNINLEPA